MPILNKTAVGISVIGALIASSPAYATGTIECQAVNDSGVTAFISIGRLPVLDVLTARFTANGQVWTTADDDAVATRISFGQGIDIRDMLRADFTDTNIEEVLISLRTVRADDDKMFAEAGVLSITGVGVWPVTCESG